MDFGVTQDSGVTQGVRLLEVGEDEADIRLDRWFKRHFPGLGHGRLEKLLRTGQVRVDGRRAKASHRVSAGCSIRVPPLEDSAAHARPRRRPSPPQAELDAARDWVLYRDDLVIAINKPPGLAVQGGSGVHRHLDGLLDGLRFDAAERPRLVHRLDRDTSGVMLLARTATAARRLSAAFRGKSVRKVYWGLVVGVPRPARGRIDAPLVKRLGAGGEKTVTDADGGKSAVTYYRVMETAARQVSRLALWPLTGRTHQLRVHCAEVLGRPIVGDGKYGGAPAFLAADGLAKRPHLHAHSIVMPHPGDASGRHLLQVTAPLPPHMREAWKIFGFDANDESDPFAELVL